MAPSEQSDPGSASNADVGPLPPWFRRKLTVLSGIGVGTADTLRVAVPETSQADDASSPTKAEMTSKFSANGGIRTPDRIPPWRDSDLQRKGAFITPDDPETKRKTRDKMRFKVRRAQKRWREKQEAMTKDTRLDSHDDDDSEADVEAVASMLVSPSNDI
ncbi:hypothetical protein LXA43DRAFT_1066682 [Ganoderma leucocontextum]|nr:hypothetical protein LXA43DRAFT_1066682 [Ganoderma leucocontextum]